jgi:hypothetical protein
MDSTWRCCGKGLRSICSRKAKYRARRTDAGPFSGLTSAATDAHAQADRTAPNPVIRSQEEMAGNRFMQTSSSMRRPTR